MSHLKSVYGIKQQAYHPCLIIGYAFDMIKFCALELRDIPTSVS